MAATRRSRFSYRYSLWTSWSSAACERTPASTTCRQPPILTDAGDTPVYGKNKINLAKRAGHRQGWQTITYNCRGVEVTRQYKTFLATSELVSGQIRVVILRFEDGSWAPYFCTDTSAEVRDILEAVAARWAIEEHFHDVKEVWGAGQQQVRNVWSSIACWHLNQWLYTLVELCCWDVSQPELTDRRARSWDNPDRRPSHADRRRWISRQMLQKQFLAVLPNTPDSRKFRKPDCQPSQPLRIIDPCALRWKTIP